ncbi:ribosomal protein L22/L17 [Baffinella frigidus]|nr:ribosomal protein L22/L17 [Cryptophyta sp. CCMP2293]
MEKEAEKPVINTLTNPAHNAEHHDFPRARSLKRKFKTSVKKLMMVCKLVRRARVDAALMQLTLSPKRAARTVRQLIYDAKFNASNNHGMDPDRLLIDEIKIGRAGYLKRVEYKGRGKTGIRRRPYCYCAIYVREIQPTDVRTSAASPALSPSSP